MPNSKSPAPMSVEEAVKRLTNALRRWPLDGWWDNISESISVILAAYEESQPLAQAALTWHKELQDSNQFDGKEDLRLSQAIAKHKRKQKYSDSHLLDTGDEVKPFMGNESAWIRQKAEQESNAFIGAGSLVGWGRWVQSSEYTEIQLTHIRACEPHRWRVDEDGLGFVWEPMPVPSTGDEGLKSAWTGCHFPPDQASPVPDTEKEELKGPYSIAEWCEYVIKRFGTEAEKVKTEPPLADKTLDDLLSKYYERRYTQETFQAPNYSEAVANTKEAKAAIHQHVAALVQAEREKCARVIESWQQPHRS